MTAADICTEAARLVAGDRDRTHGNKQKNFGDIAAIWSAYLHRIFSDGVRDIHPDEAASMMELMKVARRITGAHNPDDYIDGAGYAGCAGELAEARHCTPP